jgi:hypothetical protein
MTDPPASRPAPVPDSLAAVPTVTQGEKCKLRRSRHAKEAPYTNYDRFITTYRVDQPTQGRLL